MRTVCRLLLAIPTLKHLFWNPTYAALFREKMAWSCRLTSSRVTASPESMSSSMPTNHHRSLNDWPQPRQSRCRQRCMHQAMQQSSNHCRRRRLRHTLSRSRIQRPTILMDNRHMAVLILPKLKNMATMPSLEATLCLILANPFTLMHLLGMLLTTIIVLASTELMLRNTTGSTGRSILSSLNILNSPSNPSNLGLQVLRTLLRHTRSRLT